jgi:hypothetical protein
LRAFVIADAKEALFDEADDGGENMVAIELVAFEIGKVSGGQPLF